MTNAECLSGESSPSVEDMAVGMIIEKVADDFGIEVKASIYIPLYHHMKNWLSSEKDAKK